MVSMSGLSNWADGFLGDRDNPLRWTMPDAPEGFVLHSIFRGQGSDAVEVAVATTQTAPGVESVRRLWKERHASRRSPVLLVVGYQVGEAIRIGVCGPAGETTYRVDLSHQQKVSDSHGTTRTASG